MKDDLGAGCVSSRGKKACPVDHNTTIDNKTGIRGMVS